MAWNSDPVLFSRSETIDILAALESVSFILEQIGRPDDVFAIFEAEEATALVRRRLWLEDGEV